MKKRSRYRPRGVILDTMAHVRLSVAPLTDMPKLIDLRIKNHDALATLAQGKATKADLDIVIAALNVAEALCMADVGDQYRQQLTDAQNALLAVCERARHVCTGQELTAINWAMELHDAQMEVITVHQLETAVKKVTNIIRSGAARKVGA